MKHSIFLFAAAALVSGCSVTRQLEYKEFTARNLEPKQEVVMVPVKGEIEVIGDRIDITKTYPLKEGAITVAAIQEYKKQALSEVAQAQGADVIVGALTNVNYQAKSTDKKAKAVLSIQITGYPAKYVGFKNIQASDEAILRYYYLTEDNSGDGGRNTRGITNK